jgi:hypothetical protein
LRANSTNSKISLFSPNNYPPTTLTTITTNPTANLPISTITHVPVHHHQMHVANPTLISEVGNSCYANENYKYENGRLKCRDDRGEYDITYPRQSWTTMKMKRVGFHQEDNPFHNDNSCPQVTIST